MKAKEFAIFAAEMVSAFLPSGWRFAVFVMEEEGTQRGCVTNIPDPQLMQLLVDYSRARAAEISDAPAQDSPAPEEVH